LLPLVAPSVRQRWDWAPPGGFPITAANVEYHQTLIDAGYDATLTILPGGHELGPCAIRWDVGPLVSVR
jgi:hypothetical protein